MKITPEHYAALKQAIAPLAPKLKEHRAFIVQEGKARDIEMRLRWDALYASKFQVSPLYTYLNDTHIDTALRSIMAEIMPA